MMGPMVVLVLSTQGLTACQGSLACGEGTHESDGACVADDATDADTDSDAGNCNASVTLSLPPEHGGGDVVFDGCVDWSLDATHEFDPDDPAEIRSLEISLSAYDDTGFECRLDLGLNGLCGDEQYLLFGLSSAALITHDCAGIPDDLEGEFGLSWGVFSASTLSAGTEPGNLTGEAVPYEVVATVKGGTSTGIGVSASMDLSGSVIGYDWEEGECAGLSNLRFDRAFSNAVALSGTTVLDQQGYSVTHDALVPPGCPLDLKGADPIVGSVQMTYTVEHDLSYEAQGSYYYVTCPGGSRVNITPYADGETWEHDISFCFPSGIFTSHEALYYRTEIDVDGNVVLGDDGLPEWFEGKAALQNLGAGAFMTSLDLDYSDICGGLTSHAEETYDFY